MERKEGEEHLKHYAINMTRGAYLCLMGRFLRSSRMEEMRWKPISSVRMRIRVVELPEPLETAKKTYTRQGKLIIL
jgi:hypothetical protein